MISRLTLSPLAVRKQPAFGRLDPQTEHVYYLAHVIHSGKLDDSAASPLAHTLFPDNMPVVAIHNALTDLKAQGAYKAEVTEQRERKGWTEALHYQQYFVTNQNTLRDKAHKALAKLLDTPQDQSIDEAQLLQPLTTLENTNLKLTPEHFSQFVSRPQVFSPQVTRLVMLCQPQLSEQPTQSPQHT